MRPRKPKASTPPNTPRKMSAIGIEVPRAIKSGLMKLSTLETASVPQRTRNAAMPSSPLLQSQTAAGSQMSGGPIGMTESTQTAKDKMSTPGTPAIQKPMPATSP